jgi:NitT/TauT family transport system substrate-binding protein
MLLDWVYQGPNSGFMVAKDQGFYEKAGLDVALQPGKGSGSTAQLVASKVAQFGFSDGYVVGNSVSRSLPIKMVGAVYRRNPTALIVMADSSIKQPKDLEGKSVGIAAGSAQFLQFPAYIKGCGLDGSKIQVVNIDPVGATPALVTGRVDAVAGFAQGTLPGIEARAGRPARALWYADCNVDVVSNGIIVHTDLLHDDPDLIRSFVAATLQGFLYARQHPDEAALSVKKYLPTVDPAVSRREFELSWNNWVTPNTAGKPLGWMSEKDWASTIDVLKEYGGVTGKLTPSEIFTNDFVPTGAEFIPPQS